MACVDRASPWTYLIALSHQSGCDEPRLAPEQTNCTNFSDNRVAAVNLQFANSPGSATLSDQNILLYNYALAIYLS